MQMKCNMQKEYSRDAANANMERIMIVPQESSVECRVPLASRISNHELFIVNLLTDSH